MNRTLKQISVCICTFQRPTLLRQTLDSVVSQETRDAFTFSLVVVDNDKAESARPVVEAFQRSTHCPIIYVVEPRQNIALARNRAVARAEGELIAFLDDDEFPVKDWLWHLFHTCMDYGVEGMLGPVKPRFEREPPSWVTRGRFFDRPTHVTGTEMDWRECRTGNVLFRKRILEGLEAPFQPQFGTGGEDVDFFQRMKAKGCRFLWCDEAVVYETVPLSRSNRSYLLQRALLRGGNSLKNPTGRVRNLVKSIVAIPLYLLALPLLLIAGHHLFMRYLVKLCDHTGRLLAALGLHPMRTRNM